MISSPEDFRAVARRRLPPFLFHYVDGGANAEDTLRANVADFRAIALRQRVLKDGSTISLATELFGETLRLPVVLAPVGLTGMYARRGEVQAARAAATHGIPFTLSTVSICAIEEVAEATERAPWFQLYVLKDRGFMRSVLDRAWAAGVRTLVFTVDMPVPGARYRDARAGMSGRWGPMRRVGQAMLHPRWAWDVGVRGRPHDLGNISRHLGSHTGLADYIGWLGANFDPSITWRDLAWLRESWRGSLVIKGILDPADAKDAMALGADGIVVSNHGGRQLDGTRSTISALPRVADAVGGRVRILVDSGVRTGLDVVRAMALGADAAMIGRAYIYALAADGERGVSKLLDLIGREIAVALSLTGVSDVRRLDREVIDV